VSGKDAWSSNKIEATGITFNNDTITPAEKSGTYKSIIQTYPDARKASSITLTQVPTWLSWEEIPHIGPKNLRDAPVALRVAEGDYWLFGRYKQSKKADKSIKTGKKITLDGIDSPLTTTALPNVYDAPGGKKPSQGGYHAWQSKDMKTWIHHGPVSTEKGKWLTTAERVGDDTYFYYDFPNDQDPHLIIDSDLSDGEVGKEKGLSFKDPSDGSDCAVIRSLDGKFHLISEDWSCIDASVRSWDSPLASHAVSADGISAWTLVDPAVDYRTKPTGKKKFFFHPHWTREDPENFPGETPPSEFEGKHRIDLAKKYTRSTYEVHAPEQEAYGDWASIAIGGQYYLFGDYDPVGAHGKQHMKTVWFTSDDINKPFVKCSTIGSGHPDPDIIFAEGKFWLISQTDDFVSDGPWVDGVEVRVGVDIDRDKVIDQWTEWTRVKETYSGVDGFSKQVAKTPAQLDLSALPEGYGFKYEIRLASTENNGIKPELSEVTLSFQ